MTKIRITKDELIQLPGADALRAMAVSRGFDPTRTADVWRDPMTDDLMIEQDERADGL